MVNKRSVFVWINGVSEKDYENYRELLELKMRDMFSLIEEKSRVDADFKNGEGPYAIPFIIRDLSYTDLANDIVANGGLEICIVYRMREGEITANLAFELCGGIYMMIYKENEEYRDRTERLKTIAADTFQNIIDGLREKGIRINGKIHMKFNSYDALVT